MTTSGPRPDTPTRAWQELTAGNARFVAGTPAHPNQDASHRDTLTQGQQPFATFFGCSDSRVAAEVIFDQGLGDLFVVRTAGHVVGPTELGSLEFGTAVLGIPLIVILGHDSCGAVKATVNAVESGQLPKGFIRDLVERVIPSVLTARRAGLTSIDQVEAEHVRHTMHLIQERSHTIAECVQSGKLAIIGLTYSLQEGRARVVDVIGNLESAEVNLVD